MPHNVEIKAAAREWAVQLALAADIAPLAADLLQEDTFFGCAHGRLKLRVIREGGRQSAVLIAYARADRPGPKASAYELAEVPEPETLRAVLGAALGVGVTVRKRRLLFLVGQTRVHFDEVQGLGRFVELEVVLRPEQSEADGAAIARDLMGRLHIVPEDLVPGAYADLMTPSTNPRPG